MYPPSTAKTEEDLKRIEDLEVPVMKQAIGAYRAVTATDEFRQIERMRADARNIEASALGNARRKAEKAKAIEIAKNALKMKLPIDDIIKLTGLAREEVEALRDADK